MGRATATGEEDVGPGVGGATTAWLGLAEGRTGAGIGDGDDLMSLYTIPPTTKTPAIAKNAISCFDGRFRPVPPNDGGGAGFPGSDSAGFGGTGSMVFGISAEGLSASGFAGDL